MQKALFVPLKSEYFEGFKQGSKTTEFRPLGDRWNRDTVYLGRTVTLARGYGWPRLHGHVSKVTVSTKPSASAAWRACYGPGVRDVISIECKLDILEPTRGHKVRFLPGTTQIQQGDILVDTMRHYGTVYRVLKVEQNGDALLERYMSREDSWSFDGTYQVAVMTGYRVYRESGQI